MLISLFLLKSDKFNSQNSIFHPFPPSTSPHSCLSHLIRSQKEIFPRFFILFACYFSFPHTHTHTHTKIAKTKTLLKNFRARCGKIYGARKFSSFSSFLISKKLPFRCQQSKNNLIFSSGKISSLCVCVAEAQKKNKREKLIFSRENS